MLVFDAHALILWVEGKLSPAAMRAVDTELSSKTCQIIVPAICTLRLCGWVRSGRLKLSMSLDAWIDLITDIPGVELRALDSQVLLLSHEIMANSLWQDNLVRDAVVATAKLLGCSLVSPLPHNQVCNSQNVIW
jgi:PIN domain nuclease of toxin-antitoxin system